jgi:transcriptional regulator with XRE-family HTH domain
VGYRGKVDQQLRARQLRAEGWTMPDIATTLGVSRSSVSLWTRDVVVEMGPRRVRTPRPNRLRDARLAEIAELDRLGIERLGTLGEQAFLAAGAALYAGEGAKRDRWVGFTNSDPDIVQFFVAWLRAHFSIDESKLRVRLYLHEGLDLDAATEHWVERTGIPASQFRTPHRPPADDAIRTTKHVHGIATVSYSCSRTHRAVMGLVRALLSSTS